MRPPRPLLLSIPPFALALAASLATAAHVAPVLPLASGPIHAHEKFSPMTFPAGDYSSYDFSFADLSNCAFAAGTNLSGASFRGAILASTSFKGCNLDRADFSVANLTNAFLPCMGGGKFSGAILTGAVGGGRGCDACGQWGPNVADESAVGPLPALCLEAQGFGGLVAGVVFSDLNRNGQLDLGEPGVPGASVYFSAGPPQTTTDARGSFSVPWAEPSHGLVGVKLPEGWELTGPAVLPYNLAEGRSVQQLYFPAIAVETPAQHSTFGQLKARYR
jgi:hypothetical protein